MMLHLPSTYTEGNRTAHMQSIQMLDSTREAILNAYELKAGGKADRAEFRRMMNAETWLTAQEAVDCGLADGIIGETASIAPQNVMNAIGSGIRALGCAGMPDITELRARYMAEQHPTPETDPAPTASTGGEPDADTGDWQAQARLDLEKIRF